MKIEIKNLGAIKNAEINLNKRLTVFCGPNNSGKTYAAFIIYALTKSGLKYFRSNKKNNLILELIENQKAVFNIDVEDIWNYRKNELESIKESLDSIYGISEDIVNNLFNGFSINILESKEKFSNSISDMNFENELKLNNVTISISKKINSKTIDLSLHNKTVSKDSIEMLNLFLNAKLFSLIGFYPFTSSHILPVERNSIYTFSKELSIQKQEFLDRAQALGSKSNSRDPFHWLLKSSKRYPLPIRDGLEIAEDLSNYSKTKTEFYELAEEIESELLQGKVIITKEGDVQFSSNKAKSKKIPIHLTASIVKTLSSLVFYLKHIATKNELIIIDEPELNLHPNNQVYLTRIFAKLINKGFRLLISTHSDYIIREINNLIMASSDNEATKKVAEKFGYTQDVKLDSNSISAYLFNYKNKSSRNVTISPIKVSNTGFDVETIDKTIDELNDTSEELFYSIKYGLVENE
uniref:AAA family ATPase n=1 Tax=Gelidibacter sp. TaxID=2018083 RepID=UPI00404AE711